MFITARESNVPSRNQVNYHMEDPVSSHTLCLNISLRVQAVGLLHLCVGFIIDFIVNLISGNFRRHKEDAVCCTVSNAPGLLGTRRSKEACSCSSQYSLHPLAPSTSCTFKLNNGTGLSYITSLTFKDPKAPPAPPSGSLSLFKLIIGHHFMNNPNFPSLHRKIYPQVPKTLVWASFPLRPSYGL